MTVVLSMCFFSNLAINAMENGKNKNTGFISKVKFVKPEEYLEVFKKKFGGRKEFYTKTDVEDPLNKFNLEYPIISLPRHLINRKDYIDKYLNEYFDYLILLLDNKVDKCEGHIENFSISTLYKNIRDFQDDLKQKYKDFTNTYEGNEKYRDYIMKNYIDDILSIKYHFIGYDNFVTLGVLEDEILKDKLNKIYEKVREKLTEAKNKRLIPIEEEKDEIELYKGLDESYEEMMKIIDESIKFDEDLKEGHREKNEKNMNITFENLFKTEKAIADFLEVVNIKIALLRQIRLINPERIEKSERNDTSDFINFIP